MKTIRIYNKDCVVHGLFSEFPEEILQRFATDLINKLSNPNFEICSTYLNNSLYLNSKYDEWGLTFWKKVLIDKDIDLYISTFPEDELYIQTFKTDGNLIKGIIQNDKDILVICKQNSDPFWEKWCKEAEIDYTDFIKFKCTLDSIDNSTIENYRTLALTLLHKIALNYNCLLISNPKRDNDKYYHFVKIATKSYYTAHEMMKYNKDNPFAFTDYFDAKNFINDNKELLNKYYNL